MSLPTQTRGGGHGVWGVGEGINYVMVRTGIIKKQLEKKGRKKEFTDSKIRVGMHVCTAAHCNTQQCACGGTGAGYVRPWLTRNIV